MARDALEHHIDPQTGELVWDNLPRLPGGAVDWAKLGGEHPLRVRMPDGRVHVIDPKPSVPDPTDPTGRPVRPS